MLFSSGKAPSTLQVLLFQLPFALASGVAPRRHEGRAWPAHILLVDSSPPAFQWGLSNFLAHISATVLPELAFVLLVLLLRLFLLTVVLGRRVVQERFLLSPSPGFPCFRPFLSFPLSSCHESLYFVFFLFIFPFRKFFQITST